MKSPPDSRAWALADLLLNHLTTVLVTRLRCPPCESSLPLQVGLSPAPTHLNTKVAMPTKKDARLGAKNFFPALQKNKCPYFPRWLENGAFVLALSLSSEALALWNEIKFKVAHQVCARSAFSCLSALGRAVSSELSAPCSIQVLCTQIECILSLWSKEC